MTIRPQILESSLAIFRSQKRRADRAIAQCSNAQLHEVPCEDGNSIVILMKHLAGNMRSRWTDFLHSDGEKPDRNRDGEFVDDFESREQLDAWWEGGWACLFEAIEALRPEDLERSVTIRGESHSVIEAIHRQMDHYGHHVGQIVHQARAMLGNDWKTLSVPRGGSEAFNQSMGHTSS